VGAVGARNPHLTPALSAPKGQRGRYGYANLQKAGHDLVVHDLRRGAAEPVALGADRLIEGIAAFQLSGKVRPAAEIGFTRGIVGWVEQIAKPTT